MSVEITPCSKLFELTEARELLPLIQGITLNYQVQLAPVQQRMNMMLSNDPRRNLIETEYEEIVNQWRNKIERLGATVFGLWVVEFDVGGGHLCWRHPELTLNYFRRAGSRFSDRVKLSDYIESNDPDWAHR